MFRFLSFLLLLACPAFAAPDERFLKADGNHITDGKGRTIQLRGVNLGGWLLFEPWMSPMDSSGLKDHHSGYETLVKRFGEDTAASLLDTYQENWITAKDLDNISALGMNLIRIPFWYRNLETEDGASIPEGFRRMDWVVTEAWKRGIYSVLDLHGAPGGQIKGVSTGRERPSAGLWEDERNLERTAAIWRRVAAHYQGNPAVAAYDLLNEPAEAPTLGALWAAYDRLYREIRRIDPDHMISVEGCINAKIGDKSIGWGWEALPHPDLFGWKNVLYQIHHYEWDWNNLEKQKSSVDRQIEDWNRHKSYGVPAYMGEFNPMAHDEAWLHALEKYSMAGMSWSFWSYKSTRGNQTDSWGLYNPVNYEAPNLLADDAATIRSKWEATRTERSFALNPLLDRVLKAALPRPPAPADEGRGENGKPMRD